MERNKPASVLLEEWSVKKFGEQPPARIDVPDFTGNDNDDDALRAYYAEWGTAIAANSAAISARWAVEQARRQARK